MARQPGKQRDGSKPGTTKKVADKSATEQNENPDRNGFNGSYDDRDEQGRHISREKGDDRGSDTPDNKGTRRGRKGSST